ncbi:MAG: ImmA/IrrE family metallo-endopeptidase [Deltaproteobacteria bacterium]|nr:ImmA/IrrE family metallo-endopeptidase [Deltaproteobacteria bacterium]
MTVALITPAMLAWARQRSTMPVDSVASKLKVPAARIEDWEAGRQRPTFRQARDLAGLLHVPFGYFYLAAPPEEPLPVVDLRTLAGAAPARPSTALRDALSDAVGKQEWYRDLLEDHGAEPVSVVGKFAGSGDVEAIAASITASLGVALERRAALRGWEECLSALMAGAEAAGVTVMRSSVVGANTHRHLDVEEFRGFALCDRFAPIVFINGADAKAAQLFTLVHELAHIWIGVSGVVDADLQTAGADRATERLCDTVAAEVLVPKADLASQWQPAQGLAGNLDRLVRRYKVSGIVVARRAADLGLIPRDEFAAFLAAEKQRWQAIRDQSKDGGGNFYATVAVRNGRHLTTALVRAAVGGELLLRDVGALLGIRPDAITRLAHELGVG